MKLLERIAAQSGVPERKAAFTQPDFWTDPWLSMAAPWSAPDRERIGNDFIGYVQGAYKADGIVFACMLARQMVFSEARFQWQRMLDGRPGDLFHTAALDLLDRPAPNQTTGELLSLLEADGSLAGNGYRTVADDAGRLGNAATGPGRCVVRMRSDWVTLVISSASGDPYALDARVVGYLFEPPAGYGDSGPVVLMPDEVAHYSPIPDPEARFRGMSWLTPILREIQADKSATSHKERFFANGAMLNTIIRFDKDIAPDAFTAFVDKFNASHQGSENAYKTLFLGGGADATIVGTDLKQIDFKSVQGAGETRIAAAARVSPVIVGLSEGMAGSSLNAGNYTAAKRNFVDGTMRPLWRFASASLECLVGPPPTGSRLWFDDRDIAYLREDSKDAADILREDASSIRMLIDAGFVPDAVIEAVSAGDLRRLTGHHSGLFSVQLQRAGSTTTPPQEGQ